jgi:hypothetical protein
MSIKTHYENLKVARDAPSDVIRAAYKAITQKFNAEHYPSDDASRVMKSIHDSYAILSNPVKRAEYDRWLLERESAQVGKASAGDPDKVGIDTRRWLVYAAAGVALLIAMGWLVFSDNAVESQSVETNQIDGLTTQQAITSQPATVLDAGVVQASGDSQNAPMVVATGIPDHDNVVIDEFIGVWYGVKDAAGSRKTLDISLKSGSSLVFRLDAKAGKSIGGVYGIAAFDNGYANFLNSEYGCSMLFTIRSGILRLDTSSCQEYHETGISFDGSYSKSDPAKADMKPVQLKTKPAAKPEPPADDLKQPLEPQPAPVVQTNAPKLRKFSATVKDSDGNVNTFELIAKDKEAAKAIIRDFRGNPKIMKLKELKK